MPTCLLFIPCSVFLFPFGLREITTDTIMNEQLSSGQTGKNNVTRGAGAKQNIQKHSNETPTGTMCRSCGGQRNYESSLDYSAGDMSPPLGGVGDMATCKSQRKRFWGFLTKRKRSDGSKVLTSSCFCGRLERLSCRGRRTSADLQSHDVVPPCDREDNAARAVTRPLAPDCSAELNSSAATSYESSTSTSSGVNNPTSTTLQNLPDHSLESSRIFASASLTRRDALAAAVRRDERGFGLQQLCCTLSSVDSLASSPAADSSSVNRFDDRRLVSTTVYPLAHVTSGLAGARCDDLVFTFSLDPDDALSPGMSSLSTEVVATTSMGSVASDVGEFCCHVPRRIHTQVETLGIVISDTIIVDLTLLFMF